jgi:hypothetical protein
MLMGLNFIITSYQALFMNLSALTVLLSALTPISRGTSASASGSATSPVGASPTSDPPQQTSSPSSSDSETVGIAVGVPIAIIAICVLTWLLYKKLKENKDKQHRALPFQSQQEPFEKQEGPHELDKRASVLAPSEMDSREVRIPVSPQDVAHLSPNSNTFHRDETSNTLYPNARPNYPMASPQIPQSPSTIVSNPSDYSEWAVTPHLQQQRWSGTTAQEEAGARGEEHGGQPAQEIMGRPRIPSTIAELP